MKIPTSKLIATSVITAVISFDASAGLDCSFTGGKIEAVANASDTNGVVHQINHVNGKLQTLIKICGGEVGEIVSEDTPQFDINDGLSPPEGDCDPSTVGGQSENAVRRVQANIGKASRAANAASANADKMASVLLQCIKGE